jgi:hypothetical protein
MPRINIRFALIALLLAAIIPTATGIGVSAYLNSWARSSCCGTISQTR